MVVVTASSNATQVKLVTPTSQFLTGRLYNFCVWVRAGAAVFGSEGLLYSTLYWHDASDNAPKWNTPSSRGVARSPNTIVLDTTWRQLCLYEVLLWGTLSGYYTLDLGFGPGIYFVDDASVEWEAIAGPAAWSQPALDTRIDAARRGDFTLRFVGPGGQPLAPGALAGVSVDLVRNDFVFGTAYEQGQLYWVQPDEQRHSDEQWYADTAGRMFNSLLTENRLQWDKYEPFRPDDYRWNYDYLMETTVATAKANSMSVYGHSLVRYLNASYWQRAEGCDMYRQYMEMRIRRDVALFQGNMQFYNVFNEPLHYREALDTCGQWDTTFRDAFRWAHESDPAAQLCLNDYALIDGWSDNRWRQMYELVSGMLADGVPISCIGIEAYVVRKDWNLGMVMYYLDKLGELGLPLYITEFIFYDSYDPAVDRTSFDGTPEELAQLYNDYMQVFYAHPAVTGVFVWGFWEKNMWNMKTGLFYEDRSMSPAGAVIDNLLHHSWNTSASAGARTLRTNAYAFHGTYGRYAYRVTAANGRQYAGTAEMPRAAGASQVVTVVLDPPPQPVGGAPSAPPSPPPAQQSPSPLPSPSPSDSPAPPPPPKKKKKKAPPPPPPLSSPPPPPKKKKKARPPPPPSSPPPPPPARKKRPPKAAARQRVAVRLQH